MNYRERSILANKEHSDISVSRQAELLDISRSSIYYEPVLAMNAIDEIYTGCPFYGHRKIKPELRDNFGIEIGKKKIISLMKQMGLETIYPRKKPNSSIPDKQHKKYPYLLRKLRIIRSNQVWGTDITYVRLKKGFAYLIAILDWYSRYVISWTLASTLESIYCIQTLKRALEIALAEIHNSDQGTQFTDNDYIAVLLANEIRISMDGRGRCMDNIFTERLWRTVKQENIYLNDYTNIGEAHDGLKTYFQFYNEKRRHQSLEYRTPAQIYFSK